MTKSEFFKFAHQIAKSKDIAYYGSYRAAFGAVLKNLYAKGYLKATVVSARTFREMEIDRRIAA